MSNNNRIKAIEENIWNERIRRVSERLKPCPCCGGKAKIKELYRTDEHYIYKVEYVVCSQCGLMTKELITNVYYDERHTPEEAAELWNRRV